MIIHYSEHDLSLSEIDAMLSKTTKPIVCISLLLCAAAMSAFAEESTLVSGLVPAGDKRMELERTLEGLLLQVPKAIKVFEFHDEALSMTFVKLSNNSFGTLTSGITGATWKVVNFKDGALIRVKPARQLTGDFSYKVFSPQSGQLVPIGYTWDILEYEFDMEHSRHLILAYDLSGPGGKARKSVSIAVDWEKGRAEAVKVVPLKEP